MAEVPFRLERQFWTTYFIEVLMETGISKKDIAEHLGVSANTITNWITKEKQTLPKQVDFARLGIAACRTAGIPERKTVGGTLGGSIAAGALFGMRFGFGLPGLIVGSALGAIIGSAIDETLRKDERMLGLLDFLGSITMNTPWEIIINRLEHSREILPPITY